MFSRDTYVGRRDALASRLESGLLVFPGNNESPMNYADNCYTFRQDSTFLYYFGLDQADLAAVIDIDIAGFGKCIAQRSLFGLLRKRSTVQQQQSCNNQNSHGFLPSIDGRGPSVSCDYLAIWSGDGGVNLSLFSDSVELPARG